jgi:phage FluMu protein Com
MSSAAADESAQGTSSDPIDVESIDIKCPLWRHVNKIKGSNPFEGNAKSECKFCEKVITVSYTRVRAHLLKIPNYGVSIGRKVTYPYLETSKWSSWSYCQCSSAQQYSIADATRECISIEEKKAKWDWRKFSHWNSSIGRCSHCKDVLFIRFASST